MKAASPLGELRVISLERTPDRLTRFQTHNAHVPGIVPFHAVAGAGLDRAALIEAGFIRAENSYSTGALGAMMSHVALWLAAVQQNSPVTIFEDDAVLHGDFTARADAVLAALPHWDAVLWGSNLDWAAVVQMAPGLPASALIGRPDLLQPEPAAFQASVFQPQPARLFASAGMFAYTVSAAGAQLLLERCLPFGAEMPADPMGSGRPWANTGFDVELCRHYAGLQAFHCLPPLAYSPNDHAVSTIRGNQAG